MNVVKGKASKKEARVPKCQNPISKDCYFQGTSDSGKVNEEEKAAIVIQSHLKGMMTRKNMKDKKR